MSRNATFCSPPKEYQQKDVRFYELNDSILSEVVSAKYLEVRYELVTIYSVGVHKTRKSPGFVT